MPTTSSTLFNSAIANKTLKEIAQSDATQGTRLQQEADDLLTRFAQEMSENFKKEVQKVIQREVQEFQKQILSSVQEGELSLQQGVSGLLQQLASLASNGESHGFSPSQGQQASQFIDVFQFGQNNR